MSASSSRPISTEPAPETACPDYPAEIESLIGVLAWQRAHLPGRVVCHRIVRRREGLVATPLAVETLCDLAARGATHLAAHGVAEGERVILSLSDPLDFLAAFFAVQARGAIPVPLPTAGEAGMPRSFAARIRGVMASCRPSLAIVEDLAAFERAIAGIADAPRVIAPARLREPAVAAALRDRPARAPAFIQYTSGSTGAPKGVVITHANVLANTRAIRDATGYTRADRMVSWLPLHHDMGLVGGLLTSIYCAAETWLMAPLAFLGRPVTWLEAIGHYAATLTVAPTFAYSLCARKIPAKQLAGLDLSSLRLAYVGAEPIDPATLDAFQRRFAAYGLPPTALYPVYGLAEATLAVAVPAPGAAVRLDVVDRRRLAETGIAAPVAADAAGAVALVGVGRPLPRHAVQIVDPATGAPLGERRVGELVVAGASVSPGYFEDRDAAERSALATGDLAYVADGEIFVVDRIKDLVIVAGQNFAPSDIEAAAADVPGVRRGRIVAFSRASEAGTEALHVVAEASAEADRAPEEMSDELRRRLREAIGLAPASVTIVAPGSLERTSSGKLRRRACAEAHAAGTLAVLRTRADLRSVRWRQRLGRLRHGGGRAARAVLRRLGLGAAR